MTANRKANQTELLDKDTLEILGSNPALVTAAGQNPDRLRKNVLATIDREVDSSPAFTTIPSGDGPWIELQAGVARKTLQMDESTGLESFLMRLQPGVFLDGHEHEEDELCIVIEGDVSFDDIDLVAGDFHLARRGTRHGRASSVHGALIFLQSKVAPAYV